MTHSDRKKLGRTLAAARRAAGLTQREAARRAGITPVYLCVIEKGRASPRLGVLASICRVLGLRGPIVLAD